MATLDWALRYRGRFSFAMVPLPHAQKAPRHAGWNLDENLLRTDDQLREHFAAHPDDGIGVCLEPSGLCSIDPDYPDGARAILDAEGIDLDALTNRTPTIVGRAPRLQFRAPPDIALGRKAVTWPPREPGDKPITVIEFRAGRVQDVLPPSIHPGEQRPYYWATSPRAGFPPLPDELLALWLDFERFKHRARNLCPWAPPEPNRTESPPPRPARPHDGPSVIAAFNEAHDAASILTRHGYERSGKRRWKSPDGHGVAGIVLLESGKVYCHHASDALCDGHAHDAFDLWVRLDHAGDYRAAVKAAAHAMGMNRVAA